MKYFYLVSMMAVGLCLGAQQAQAQAAPGHDKKHKAMAAHHDDMNVKHDEMMKHHEEMMKHHEKMMGAEPEKMAHHKEMVEHHQKMMMHHQGMMGQKDGHPEGMMMGEDETAKPAHSPYAPPPAVLKEMPRGSAKPVE